MIDYPIKNDLLQLLFLLDSVVDGVNKLVLAHTRKKK
jgi:hypothetical protein